MAYRDGMVCRPVGSSFRVVWPQPKAVYKGA